MAIHQASGYNVNNCIVAVRRHFGWKYKDSLEVTRSNSGDNLYRVTLSNGEIVEVTTIHHARCKYEGTIQ